MAPESFRKRKVLEDRKKLRRQNSNNEQMLCEVIGVETGSSAVAKRGKIARCLMMAIMISVSTDGNMTKLSSLIVRSQSAYNNYYSQKKLLTKLNWFHNFS